MKGVCQSVVPAHAGAHSAIATTLMYLVNSRTQAIGRSRAIR